MNIEKFSKNGFVNIQNANILGNNDVLIMKTLSKELQRVFEVHQVFRTETEMRYSVLDDVRFPTPASKYWQSIREQNVFYTNLIYLACDFEEKQGNLELLKIELSELKTNDTARIKIKKAQIKRTEFLLAEMMIEAKDRVREIAIWEQFKEELKTIGKFDIDNVNTDQPESLRLRWERQLEISQKTGHESLGKNSLTGLMTMENKPKIG